MRSPRAVRQRASRMHRRRGPFSLLGPGLISGASDDDPSGIATCIQVGAQHGLSLLWTLFLTIPMMVAIQEISARVGRVTGHGLSSLMSRHYPRGLLIPFVGLLVVTNAITLGADVAGMASAVRLLVGGPVVLYALLLAALSVALEIFVPYRAYVRALKWLTLVLLAYVAVAFAVRVPWAEALRHTLLPSLERPWRTSVAGLVAMMGTTVSPYLFFWQSSEEVDDQRVTPGDRALLNAPGQAPAEFRRIRADTWTGMIASNVISWFIVLSGAATLHGRGSVGTLSPGEAAQALEPVAGRFAATLFSIGIVGTGLIALPVLAGSAAYAVGDALGWRTGLEHRPRRAKAFYAVIALATLGGMVLPLVGVRPIAALFWSAVLNGVVAGPLMAAILVLASNPRVMGRFAVRGGLRWAGWAATVIMLLAALALLLPGGS